MKTIKIIGLLILTSLFSCKSVPSSYSAEVSFVAKEEQGTITVRSNGFGKNEKEAIKDAQKNAFNVLLFKGLPGTEINVPLVSNEYEAKNSHKDYFDNLFENGGLFKYLMVNSSESVPVKVKGGYSTSLVLKINYNSLRKDLEQNGVIRKFGL
ncbi:hypothetical protein [uncultured Flavobacterium sp.]|uniref:hypothetical protein n=1 Tax=uncultured Flavobacterium sp. TaxID=165435 RepID=UPI002628DE49|nr:hypothetical protein [uncultured Flavobacterium sp.]